MLMGIEKGAMMADEDTPTEPGASQSEQHAAQSQSQPPVPQEGATSAAEAMYGSSPQQPASVQQQTTPIYGAQPTYGQQHSQQSAASGYPAYSPSYLGQQYSSPAAQASQPETSEKKGHSTGTLLSGLAIAALIGGIVGGGVSSLVVANLAPQSATVAQHSGAVTLNNPESVTEVTGVAAVATPSVVTLEVQGQSAAGSGSGVIYSEDGYIITNAHVATLDGAASDVSIRVKLSDGRVFDGTIVGVAPYSDIAVVKIEADNLTPIEVADSTKVNVGDVAVAIGAPLNLANTVTSGVVSALNRGISVGSPLIPESPDSDQPHDDGSDGQNPGFPWDFRFQNPGQEEEDTQQSVGQVTLPVIQTDASINPGNSGGALLNNQGQLIGINVAIASPGATEGTAASAGLGFAIPAQLATRVADEIIAGEQPSHGLLGASVADSSFDTDADANHAGGLLQDLTPGGAADEAGLRAGDVITAINGIPATDGTTVSALIRMQAGGSEITIDYTRNGEAGQTTATLGTLDW
ncbi:S1C family serine protease [Leucobacter denitrificans]|uniref:Trypsin-like peptidase domain-containing protein n=1 Tax=Leucobacter denitrificans TaxID=683042 RepID=A0A7G9S4X0_9MICO|nr:trypsin-like peptidase domain-containing protein [Leucobacter denitrificans]QNN62895.1 trypsin-like peptidase domain-containing protein [Leucobacter denitrificans]